ncbi:hypothetical protein LBMAG42_29080 [Deltaproteobacteria bacterium]|nr:hypothetical protein LBMAG42_29080 [Deltaproteobacteria bacterium]
MIFVALFACAPDAIDSADSATDSATDSAADTATDTGDSADTGAVATHYFGESQGQTPDGSYVAEPEAILFIRTLDPVASTITEEVWVEGRPKWTHYLLVHEVDAAAGTFTSEWVTADGTLDVVGGYDAGEAWAWTAWHSTSTYRDGTYAGTVVTSQDSVDGAGVATAHKDVYDGDGTHSWQIVEVITPTTEAEFTAALAEIKWE